MPTTTAWLALVFAVAHVLITTGNVARADDPPPSFRTATDRETKEFATKVFDAIVKAARSRPNSVAMEKYEYSRVKDKEGRTEMRLVGSYKGSITRIKVKVNITVHIDSIDPKGWKVSRISYTDDNKISVAEPNHDKVGALVAKFNR